MFKKKVLGTVVAAALTVFAGAASANAVCMEKNGYDGAGLGDSGTWAAITAASGYFNSGTVKGACEVKDQFFDGKGPPRFQLYAVNTNNRDQCSLYKSVATVRSKLQEGSNSNALLIAQQIVVDTQTLMDAGKLDPTKGAAIKTAAIDVAQCISFLPMTP